MKVWVVIGDSNYDDVKYVSSTKAGAELYINRQHNGMALEFEVDSPYSYEAVVTKTGGGADEDLG